MDEPKQIEIDQIKVENDCVRALKDVRKTERRMEKDFGKFVGKFEDSIENMKKYQVKMFDCSRNYVQMINQDSDIINNQVLNLTKEHVKRIEGSINVKVEILNVLKEFDKTFNEYVNNLGRLEKSWDDLVNAGNSWYSDANGLMKEKGSYASVGKLSRLEKSLEKNHVRLQKAYSQKMRDHQLVETSNDHVNQVLQKLKATIKVIRF